MTILLVEDEIRKEASITNYLQDILQNSTISIAKSVTSAIICVRQHKYDFIILDMSLPLFDSTDLSHSDNNEFDTFGGNAVLDEIDRLQLPCKVVLITAFDTLGDGENQISLSEVTIKLKEDYPDNYVGSVFYNVSSLTWKQELNRLLSKEGKKDNENFDS